MPKGEKVDIGEARNTMLKFTVRILTNEYLLAQPVNRISQSFTADLSEVVRLLPPDISPSNLQRASQMGFATQSPARQDI